MGGERRERNVRFFVDGTLRRLASWQLGLPSDTAAENAAVSQARHRRISWFSRALHQSQVSFGDEATDSSSTVIAKPVYGSGFSGQPPADAFPQVTGDFRQSIERVISEAGWRVPS